MLRIKNTYLSILLIHVGIGFAIYAFRPLAQIYFLTSIGLFTFFIFKNRNTNNEALYGAAYIVGAEVLFRMTGAAPVYEAGKYGVIGLILLGLFFSGTSRKSGAYWLYLLLLVPGIIFTAINLNYGTNFRTAITFNISGPFCLGIAALYCIDRKVTYKQLQYLCWALLMPIIAMGVYLYFYTPDTRDVLNGTASNFATSGGYGPNQVSTMLGLGAFLLIVQLFTQSKNRLVFIINLVLLSLLGYRAIVTFSRGGVFTAIVIAVLFILVYFKGSSTQRRVRIVSSFLFLGITIAATWFLSSTLTGGLIDKRYANQDASGRVKEDITTGRTELITSELSAFYEYPLTGIGIGKIKEYREAETGIEAASHNEVSRLLSEHGLAGLIALIILVVFPLIYRLKYRRNYLFFAFLGFWFLTINHSSMRIAAPALIYALSLLHVIPNKKEAPVRRKRVVNPRQYAYDY